MFLFKMPIVNNQLSIINCVNYQSSIVQLTSAVINLHNL